MEFEQNTNSKSKIKFFATLLLVMVLFIFAATGWYLWSVKNEDATQLNNQAVDLKNEKNKLQSDIKKLKTSIAKSVPKEEVESSVSTQAPTDEQMINESVKAYMAAKSADQVDGLNIVIKKREGEFASVSSSYPQGGSVAVVLKKSQGQWIPLYATQQSSEYTQKIDHDFSVPSTINQW